MSDFTLEEVEAELADPQLPAAVRPHFETMRRQLTTERAKQSIAQPAPGPVGMPAPGGPPQAGPPQAGPPQAGPPQAEPPQAEPPQAEPPQAGPPQAGPPQAGPPQAGPPQAGPPPARGLMDDATGEGEDPYGYIYDDPATGLNTPVPVEPKDPYIASLQFEEAMGEGRATRFSDNPGSTADVLAAKAREKELDRKRESRNPDYKSASQLAAFYAPPVSMPNFRAYDDDIGDYQHYEPPKEQAIAMYLGFAEAAEESQKPQHARNMRAAADSIRQYGTDSPAYERYSDWSWQQVSKASKFVGQRAFRMNYVSQKTLERTNPTLVKPNSRRGGFEAAGGDILGGATFGIGPAVVDAITTQADTPIARWLSDNGYPGPRRRSEAMDDEQGSLAGFGSNMLGVISPGSLAGAAYKGLGKWAYKKGGESASGRVVANALADLGVDTSSAMLRQQFETLATNGFSDFVNTLAEQDFGRQAAQSFSEGVSGAFVGSLPNIGAEWANSARRDAFAADPDLGALNDVGIGFGNELLGVGNTGTKGALRRASDFMTADRNMNLSRKHPASNYTTEDNILGRAVERSGKENRDLGNKDLTAEELGVLNQSRTDVSHAAARIAAEKIRPTLTKKAQAFEDTMAANTAAYLARPEVAGAKPVPATESFNTLRAEWDKARYGATTRVSDSVSGLLREVTDLEVVPASTGKAMRKRGEAVYDLDDPRFEGPWRSKLSQARAVWEKKYAATQRGSANPPLSTGTTLPGGFEAGSPASTSTKPAPKPKVMVVMKPTLLTAEGAMQSTRALHEAMNFKGSAENKEVLELAAEALRKDRNNIDPAMESVVRQNRLTLEKFENLERYTKMNKKELRGVSTDPLTAGSMSDASLDKLSLAVREWGQGSRATQDELFAQLLDNQKLTRLLRGVRAARAWEAKHGGGAILDKTGQALDARARKAGSSLVNRTLYGPGGTLARMRDTGDIPKAVHALYSPDGMDFVESVGESTLDAMVQMADQSRYWLLHGSEEDSQ